MEQIKTKKYKLANGELVSAGEGTAIRDINGILYKNREDYENGITARMRCEGYTEPQPKQAVERVDQKIMDVTPPPPEFTQDYNDLPHKNRKQYTKTTFGNDFTDEMKIAAGWNVADVLTDNRKKSSEELRDKKPLSSPLTEPAPKINQSTKNKIITRGKLTVDLVELLENGVQRILFKGISKFPLYYQGDIRLEGVKHIVLTNEAKTKWLRGDGKLIVSNNDILHINAESIGEENIEDPVYAGVITIKLQGDTKLKVAKRVNMFGGLGEELRESDNTNFSNAVKQYGIIGAEIWASPSQPSEEDAKDLKREIVGDLRERGIELYNNEPVKDTKEATVDVFACANGYKWRINQEDDWNTQPSKNLKGDMPKTYAENGGKENGMYYKIY